MNSETAGARRFAASLHAIAQTAEANADYAADQRISDAYTDAATALMDAASRLRAVADDCDGIWERLPDVYELPLEGV